MPPLNWSHFKPKFSRKPDEDAEAHLLITNDWVGTHRFQDNDKFKILFDINWRGKAMVQIHKANKHRLDGITKLI